MKIEATFALSAGLKAFGMGSLVDRKQFMVLLDSGEFDNYQLEEEGGEDTKKLTVFRGPEPETSASVIHLSNQGFVLLFRSHKLDSQGRTRYGPALAKVVPAVEKLGIGSADISFIDAREEFGATVNSLEELQPVLRWALSSALDHVTVAKQLRFIDFDINLRSADQNRARVLRIRVGKRQENYQWTCFCGTAVLEESYWHAKPVHESLLRFADGYFESEDHKNVASMYSELVRCAGQSELTV